MKRFLGALVGLLALNCGDGVGSEDCVGAGVRCRVSEDSDEAAQALAELSTKDLEELSPTWIRPLPLVPPEPSFLTMLLRNDLEGDVWFVTQNSKQLVASKLDADGEVTDSREIDPPRGGEKTVESDVVLISSLRQSAVGAALEVIWPITAETYDSETVSNEWIKFGKSVDDPLQRIVPGPDSPFYGSDLIWDADGSVFALKQPHGQWASAPLSIEKFDRKLNRIWKQSAFHGFYGNDANMWFGLLEGHRIAVLVEEISTSSFHIGVLGADGNFDPWFGQPNIKPMAPFPQQGPNGPVLIANNFNGDLVVASMRLKPRSLAGAKLLREDYQWLTITPNAVDRMGNVYVAPVIGGRAVSDQRRAICQVPVSGEPRCFLLARSAEVEITEKNTYDADLAVHADGVVFMRAGSSLVRIDFPEG